MHPIVGQLRPRDVLLSGVVLPAAGLVVLVLATRIVSVEFGTVVFWLSIVTCFGWILLSLNDRSGRRGNGARSILSRRSGRFVDVEPASNRQLLSMAKLLVGLTGFVVLGWAVLLV
ncbi:hypothetical protein [Halovivax cerinus]|uniref:Uncharacterized protein n=1 Tax=Halovivax cerinus TaxID=1487865 RepID=A0ABD5NQN6_9EURY|nr:hypothetical protein [Halovivax cerinus]